MFSVSQSKLKTWRRCHRAYHLKYVDKLRRKQKARPLEFGTIVHSMIEANLEGRDPFQVLTELERERGHLFRAEVEFYGNIIEDARIIMEEYFDHWENDGLVFDKLNGRRSELEFSVPIADGIEATGKIDGIASRDGMRWLVEHKTFNRMPGEDERWRNLQSCLYMRIIDILGLPPVDGTLWDYIWSYAPKAPSKLKSGKLQRKAMVTLPTKVIETIKSYGMKPRDYPDVISAARRRRNDYFQRIHTPVRPQLVDAVVEDFIETAKEIRDCHGVSKARNVDRHCSFCEFEGLCRAELMGQDTDFIRSRDYEKSSRPQVTEDSSAERDKAGGNHRAVRQKRNR